MPIIKLDAQKVDAHTANLVVSAWKSLLDRAVRPDVGAWNWTDHEQDTGFLKNADALLALVEPYLLSPTSFTSPGLPAREFYLQVDALLGELQSRGDQRDGAPSNKQDRTPYFGFSAAPYPYIEVPRLDYVDSAATILDLICATASLMRIEGGCPETLQKRLQDCARASVEFLLMSRVEDVNGTRWQAINKKTDPPGRYANLFFTRMASLALHRASTDETISSYLTQDTVNTIQVILPSVCKWVISQFDSARNAFWMDAARAMSQPIATFYAVQTVYTLQAPVPEVWKRPCSAALDEIFPKMRTLREAATLQMDFFHSIPLPDMAGAAFYDDRGYIGAFLSLLAQAKEIDDAIVTDDFVRAGEQLHRGVSDEWIDDPTQLWDDGRPLISYTRDALIGLVQHSIKGAVPKVTLRQDQLRNAIEAAVGSDLVIDALMKMILDNARNSAEEVSLNDLSLSLAERSQHG